MCDFLVVDCSSLLYRPFFANKNEDDITIGGLAMHSALTILNKYFNLFKPTKKLVLAFDRNSWRKEYTASEQCISKKPYKGNRRQNMTPSEKAKYERFKKHLREIEQMFVNHTSVICLAESQLEADDLIAGFIQMYANDNKIIIISTDQDLIQLIEDNVRLVDPATGKDRTLSDWGGDVKLFLYEKNLRGDIGDNVQSAFPRVRKDRINKSYKDEYDRINLMETTWNHPDGRTLKVGDLYKENQLLMDLQNQPDDIQKTIIKTILKAIENPGKFSYFHFMKFLGEFQLTKLANQATDFVKLLSK